MQPLFVDLDGTLVKSDLLYEGIAAMITQSPCRLLQLPFWLLKGKAGFKATVASHVDLDVTRLPYNRPFLEYLESQAKRGRELILATASNEKFAAAVAEHLGFFKRVLSSTEELNLAGSTKREAIVADAGEGRFDYAGNAPVDLDIWRHARRAILVNPATGIERRLHGIAEVDQTFIDKRPRLAVYSMALRLHQWLKNLLVLVPLFASHQWHQLATLGTALSGVLAFGLCASSIYLLNDLADLQSDRCHPRKRLRPLASGEISILSGVVLGLLLIVAGFSIAIILSPGFSAALLLYVVLTVAYSIRLKMVVIIDVLLLASLYTLRVISGAILIDVEMSFWLLSFSMFLFVSLAIAKRCAELNTMLRANRKKARGRGYFVTDLEYLHAMGTASGYLSVLVLALYINSPDIRQLYSQPELLWLLCPALLYWISRVWLMTGRDKMHDDPLIFAVRDRPSQYVFITAIAVVFLAV
ncbi:MAG: UbiA family prenyltransferase [Gammaproteobacteria bacterium]|nr:MAG: UbiA family prenyltransferase [Gammaproteobacteria bacterium]